MVDRRLIRAFPLTLVMVVAGVGLLLIQTGHWRRGDAVLGAAAAVGAILRLVVREADVGPLAVRGRMFDVTFLGALALLLILATSIGF